MSYNNGRIKPTHKTQFACLFDNQAGIVHFGLLLFVMLTIGVTGFVGYSVYQNNTSQADTNQALDIQTTCTEINCDEPEPADRIEDQI